MFDRMRAGQIEGRGARLWQLTPTMTKLVLLRHGQSVWNEENRFTGWTDVDLSGRGREEVQKHLDHVVRTGGQLA